MFLLSVQKSQRLNKHFGQFTKIRCSSQQNLKSHLKIKYTEKAVLWTGQRTNNFVNSWKTNEEWHKPDISRCHYAFKFSTAVKTDETYTHTKWSELIKTRFTVTFCKIKYPKCLGTMF